MTCLEQAPAIQCSGLRLLQVRLRRHPILPPEDLESFKVFRLCHPVSYRMSRVSIQRHNRAHEFQRFPHHQLSIDRDTAVLSLC